jgi:hypothetical protein
VNQSEERWALPAIALPAPDGVGPRRMPLVGDKGKHHAEGEIMRVFVAGATGALGRHQVPGLVAAGNQVTATTRYLRAFEAGRLPEAICTDRLRDLEREIAGLAARKAALESQGAQAPVLRPTATCSTCGTASGWRWRRPRPSS